jgi:putative DNA primase/helicase
MTSEGDNNPTLFSEENLALEFTDIHSGKIRYVADWGRWYIWTGKLWQHDQTRQVFDMSRLVCRTAASQVSQRTEKKRIGSARTRAAVVSLVSDDQRTAATPQQWDADPWLLNTPGGVVDLKTGTLRPHRPEDYMTKITAVAPDGRCRTPLWNSFLRKVTNNDEEYQKFLLRAAGYSLTGDTSEDAMFFAHGTGRNGKSTFLSALTGIMNDYHTKAPIEVFTVGTFAGHPIELAMLCGARLVTSMEVEEGKAWAEARIKDLTGGDPISARFMRQDFFTYAPQFKLWIYGNHKPAIMSPDLAIRRRMNLLPFLFVVPPEECDEQFAEKMKPEWPGILAQLVAGCLEWQRIGLKQPAVVVQATDEYIEEEDPITEWLAECCDTTNPNSVETISDLYKSWCMHAQLRGEKDMSSRKLTKILTERKGLKRDRASDHSGSKALLGIKLLTHDEIEKRKTEEPSNVTPFKGK